MESLNPKPYVPCWCFMCSGRLEVMTLQLACLHWVSCGVRVELPGCGWRLGFGALFESRG